MPTLQCANEAEAFFSFVFFFFSGGEDNKRGEGAGISWCKVTQSESEGYLGKRRRKGTAEEKKDVCWVWVRESDRSPGRFRSAIRAAPLSVRLAACECVLVCVRMEVTDLCVCACVSVLFARLSVFVGVLTVSVCVHVIFCKMRMHGCVSAAGGGLIAWASVNMSLPTVGQEESLPNWIGLG